MSKPQRLEPEFDPSELLGFVSDFGPEGLVRALSVVHQRFARAALVAMSQGDNSLVFPEETADSLWFVQHLIECLEAGCKRVQCP